MTAIEANFFVGNIRGGVTAVLILSQSKTISNLPYSSLSGHNALHISLPSVSSNPCLPDNITRDDDCSATRLAIRSRGHNSSLAFLQASNQACISDSHDIGILSGPSHLLGGAHRKNRSGQLDSPVDDRLSLARVNRNRSGFRNSKSDIDIRIRMPIVLSGNRVVRGEPDAIITGCVEGDAGLNQCPRHKGVPSLRPYLGGVMLVGFTASSDFEPREINGVAGGNFQ